MSFEEDRQARANRRIQKQRKDHRNSGNSRWSRQPTPYARNNQITAVYIDEAGE